MYEDECHETDKMAFVLFCVALLAIVVAVTLGGLYVVRVTTSRPIVNCGMVTSKDEAVDLLSVYPRLDADNDGKPCEDKFNYPATTSPQLPK